MSRALRRVRAAALALAVGAPLSFGAAQAYAGAAPPAAEATLACSTRLCPDCGPYGGVPIAGSFCDCCI